MRKRLALLLAICLMIPNLVLCGGAAAEEELPWIDTLWATPYFSDEKFESYSNMQNDPMIKWLGEKFHMNITVRSYSDYHNALMLMCASGTEPDAMGLLTWDGGDTLYKELRDQEALVNIGEIVKGNPDRYPVLNKIMSEEYWGILNYTRTGDYDTCYALYNLIANQSVIGSINFYMPYFEQVGYTADTLPTTMDELYEALVKIKNADVDGNGVVGDTVPWAPNTYQGTSFEGIEQLFFNTMGLYCGYSPKYEDASEYVFYPLDERSKEAHKLVAKFYKEGLIDQEFITREQYGNWAMMGSGQLASYSANLPHSPWNTTQYMQAYDTFKEAGLPLESYEDMLYPPKPIEGKDGLTNKQWGLPYTSSVNNVITVNCVDPERILDVYEFLYSDKGQDFIFFGIPGEYYDYNEEGKAEFIDADAYYEVCSHYDEPLAWNAFNITTNLNRDYCQYERDGWLNGTLNSYHTHYERTEKSEGQQYTSEVAQQYLDQCYQVLPMEYAFVSIDGEWEEKRRDIQAIMWRYYSAFWTGQMDVDENWDAFITELKNADCEGLLNEYNRQLQVGRDILAAQN